jgi:hypothetical protein
MNPNVLAAMLSAARSAAVAITALILNQRGFASIDIRFANLENRFSALENRITAIEARLDRRFEAIEGDLKDFFKVQAEHDKRIERLEDRP